MSEPFSAKDLTLEEFASKLKALLREAEDSGLDVDEFCQLAEGILESGWEESK